MKKEKVFDENSRFHCVDKGQNHHSVYLKKCAGLSIRIKNDENNCREHGHSEVKSWTLAFDGFIYSGEDKDSLINTFNTIIKLYNLKNYSNKCFYRDQLIVYTDNVDLVYGHFRSYCDKNTYLEGRQVELLKYFVISDIKAWDDRLNSAYAFKSKGQQILDAYFIPDSYVYISPYQMNRKRLARKLGNFAADNNIVPDTLQDFKLWREAYFGGTIYCPYISTFDGRFIEIDRKSAYIYEILCMPHICTKPVNVQLDSWEYYLDRSLEGSMGYYEITFIPKHKSVNVFNRDRSNQWNIGEKYTVRLELFNTDLRLFLDSVELISITCHELKAYKLDYLPKEILEDVYNAFIAKESIDKSDELYHQVKAILNAYYGSLCINVTDGDDFKDKFKKGKAWYSPIWGYTVAAYARKHLFEMGKQLSGWIYSDTDSIYCEWTLENLVLIDEYNDHLRKLTKKLCEIYGYNFNALKDLGTFNEECKISKIRTCLNKTYMYNVTNDDFSEKPSADNFVLKAAGCDKSQSKTTWTEWYNYNPENDFCTKPDYGNKKFCVVDDENGYYEYYLCMPDPVERPKDALEFFLAFKGL